MSMRLLYGERSFFNGRSWNLIYKPVSTIISLTGFYLQKNTMTLFQNPNLIEGEIDNEFHFIANPFLSEGIKILNKTQFQIFQDLKKLEIVEVCKKHQLTINDIDSFLKILGKVNAVNKTNAFYSPNPEIKLDEVDSLDFWIHTTDLCNLGCSYCFIHTIHNPTHLPENVMIRLEEKITQSVQNRKLKKVTLRLAGGEPMIKFKFWRDFLLKMRQQLAKYDCTFQIVFLTNLTFLPDGVIDFIKSEKVGIGVSLDGIGEYHDNIRFYKNGKGSFNDIEANMNILKSHNIGFTVNITITDTNMDGLLDFTKYMVKMNVPFRFSFVIGEKANQYKLLENLYQSYEYIESQIDENGFEFSRLHEVDTLKMTNLSLQTCNSGLNGGGIYVDGNIHFCQMEFGKDNVSGSIFEEDDLIDIIQRNRKPIEQTSSDCKVCSYRFICTSGCPLDRTEEKKSPNCSTYKSIIPDLYRLLAKDKLNRLKKFKSENKVIAE